MHRSIYMAVIACLFGFLLVACPEVDPTTICTSNQDCFERYGCDITGSRTCKRTCTLTTSGGSTECLASQQCSVEPGMDEGFCEPLDDTDTDASGNTAPAESSN